MEQKSDIDLEMEIVGLLARQENHVRELARILKINHMSVKRNLDKLIRKNIVDFKTLGRNNVFFLKDSFESKNKLLSYEIYKQTKIVSKYPLLREIFERIKEDKSLGLVILFGSYAKEKAHENSDIDLFINGGKPEQKKEVEKLNSLISVKIGNIREDNLLTKEIKDNHVIIKGGEKYYETEN